MADGFLSRWSRRKQDQRAGIALVEPAPLEPVAPPDQANPAGQPVLSATAPATTPAMTPVTRASAVPAPLTLADAQALTQDSDFAPFVARHVAPEVKNAAFKTLFSDPHFNVMDGLDIYIDDYTQPTPLPLSVLRQMVSAKVLGLVEDEVEKEKHQSGAQNSDQDGTQKSHVPEQQHAQESAQKPAPEPVQEPAQEPFSMAAAPGTQTLLPLSDAAPASNTAPPDVAQCGPCPEPTHPKVLPATVPNAHPQAVPAHPPHHDHVDLRLQPHHAAPASGAGRGTG